MRQYDSDFADALAAARNSGLAPVWFVWIKAKNRSTGADEAMGFWSGDEDLTLQITPPGETSAQARLYVGGCNLSVDDIRYVADLTDNPVSVSLSQIADAVQELVRTHDVRLAECEIHATAMDGGRFISDPQLEWVGVVDDAPLATPSIGSDGAVTLSVRSEIMHQLTARNPAKSSDQHQKRRSATDAFCEYAGTIGARSVQWFNNT